MKVKKSPHPKKPVEEVIANMRVQLSRLRATYEFKDKRDYNVVLDNMFPLLSILGSCSFELGVPFLRDFVMSFQLFLNLEAIRLRMMDLAEVRCLQLLPFFSGCFQRLETYIDLLETRPDLMGQDMTYEGIRKRRVLIVDDSKTFQLLFSRIVESYPLLEVVGVASDTIEAEKMISAVYPDVLILDIHMPGMDGFAFVDHLMKKYPLPIILVSSTSIEHGSQVFHSLYQGAVDFIPKAEVTAGGVGSHDIGKRVWMAAECSFQSFTRFYTGSPAIFEHGVPNLDKIVGIGAGYGSTRNLIDLLSQLPKEIPPIVMVQQIVPSFSKTLIRELHEVCPFIVKEAENGEPLAPGKVLIAPPGAHMTVEGGPNGLFIHLIPGDPVNDQLPSIDRLFDSLALQGGNKAIGILLSGSGPDGAQGLLEMRREGAYTIVQDEVECLNATTIEQAVRLEAASIACWGNHLGEVLLDALTVSDGASRVASLHQRMVVEGQGPRVLIVDDSPTIRAVMRHNLRGYGFSRFGEAKNGSDAWDLLVAALKEKMPFDLVLSDHNMPIMTGPELLKKVRAHDSFKALPFILATGVSDKSTVLDAIQNGVTGYVTKPISPENLIQKVFTALALPNNTQENN